MNPIGIYILNGKVKLIKGKGFPVTKLILYLYYKQKRVIMNFLKDGLYRNNKGLYCKVVTYYVRNTKRIQIVFSKSIEDIAWRPAINSTSERAVIRFLTKEGFEFVK
jgi:hypothetical protein